MLNRFYGAATRTLLRHDAVIDFTTLGDPVNAAARMQQHAAGGELLVASRFTSAIASGEPSIRLPHIHESHLLRID
ncbi:MAG TPA: hypothetical protein VLU24_05710 [Mycobacterium sp.]|nr:hypothetical protein [Mycobacterium sp.]